jgi:multiple sugar transport system substrate-binding protein
MKILNPIIKDFEEQNPDIKIEVMHIPQDYMKKLHLLFASNLAPDVLLINNLSLPVYTKFLEPLDNVINKKDYFNQALNSMSVDNKLYAVPRDSSTLVVYYNKNIFYKCGVGYPEKEWTIEDMISKSVSLTSKSHWGLSYEPKIYYALPFMHYFGGGILDDNGHYIGENGGSLKGLNLYKDLANKYHVAPTLAQTGSKTLAQMFLEGKIAMHISGRWLVPKYRECAKFDWDIVSFPKSKASVDSSGWAISNSSKHKDEAIKFVLFLSDKKNICKMTKDGLIVPSRIDVANSETFIKGKPESSKLFLYALENSHPTRVSKDYTKLVDKLTDKVFISK